MTDSGERTGTCPLCQKLYSPAGIAGLTHHVKTQHTAEEFSTWKNATIQPNPGRPPEEKRPPGRPKKRVGRPPKDERKPLVDDGDQGTVARAPEPARGALPQQVFLLSGAIPPADFIEDAQPQMGGNGNNGFEVVDETVPASDVRTGTATIKPVRTNNFLEANVFAFTPKVFQFSSNLLHTCWQITVNEWGWDPNMPFGNWLDLYLYMTMERLGIKLQPYVVEKPGGNGHNGGNGNGGTHAEERGPAVHAGDEQYEPPSFWFGQ